LKATRSNLPQLIAGAGGAVLVISLFLAWISVGDVSASGWESFSFIDIVLFVIGVAALAVGAAGATGATLPVRQLGPHLLKWLGVVSITIVLTFLFENDHNGFGAFIGLLAALAILAGGILSDRPDLAARVADAAGVDDAGARPTARPPTGLGAGSSTSTPAGSGVGSAGVGAPGTESPGLGASSGLGSSAAGSSAPGGAGAGTPGPGSAAGSAAPAGAAPAGPTSPASGGGAGGGPPAGWYPDPQGQARLRYWDGAGWTDQTSA
jgi:hypothetical protein